MLFFSLEDGVKSHDIRLYLSGLKDVPKGAPKTDGYTASFVFDGTKSLDFDLTYERNGYFSADGFDFDMYLTLMKDSHSVVFFDQSDKEVAVGSNFFRWYEKSLGECLTELESNQL